MKKTFMFFGKLVLTLLAIFFGCLPTIIAVLLGWLFMTDKLPGPVVAVLFDSILGVIIGFTALLFAQISIVLLIEAVIQSIWSNNKKPPQAQV